MTPAFRLAWRVATWLLVVAIVVLSLVPQGLAPQAGGGDKLGHFLAYFALTAMAGGLSRDADLRRIAGSAFLLGIALEIAQARLTAERQADWADLLANAAGIATAWYILARGGAGWARSVAAWLPGGARP